MAIYQAVWVPNDNPIDGRRLGRLEVHPSHIVWSDEADLRFSFPLQHLQVEQGGSNNKLLFLKFGDLAPGSFILDSDALLADPLITQFAHLNPYFRRKKQGSLWKIAGILFAAAGIAGVISLIIVKKAPLGVWLAEQTPPELEIKMGQLFSKQLLISKQEVVAPQVVEKFKVLTDRLLQVAPTQPAFPYKFHIVHDTATNAFAFPGGPIMITTGLLLAAEDPDEVLGVLAHELSHIHMRHVLRQFYGSTALFLVLQTVLGDISGLIAVVVQNSSYLVSQSFSRDFEREADEEAYNLLVKARINPAGLARFFNRMIEIEKETTGKIEETVKIEKLNEKFSWLSTHPITEQRKQTIEQRIASEQPKFDHTQFDYVQFKHALDLALKNKELR